jgi:hypothetical protein
MRLTQPTQSTSLSQSSSTTPVIEGSSTSGSAEQVMTHSPLQSAYLKRAIHKISSRSMPASSIKNYLVQMQSTPGAQLKVGTNARPYLKLFLAGLELDKNRK